MRRLGPIQKTASVWTLYGPSPLGTFQSHSPKHCRASSNLPATSDLLTPCHTDLFCRESAPLPFSPSQTTPRKCASRFVTERPPLRCRRGFICATKREPRCARQ